MPFTYKQLHATFGAEVEGVDFARLSDEGLEELKAAMAKYGFLVFRRTGLDDEAHVRLSYRLGDLDNTRRFRVPGQPTRYSHAELFDAGNLDAAGRVLDPDSPRAHQNRGNGLFHVDSSFNPRRASYCLLRAVCLPPHGTGGATEFADARAACAALPPDVLADLRRSDYIGRHSMAHSRQRGSPAFFRDLDVDAQPQMRHRLLQMHAGRETLYVGAHLCRVEGLAPAASDVLIRRLNDHVAGPQSPWTVAVDWHDPGDLVWWDNRVVLHRAGGGTFEGRYPRDMRRTTVHDDGPEAWGLNTADTAMTGFRMDNGVPGLSPEAAPKVVPEVMVQ